MNTSELPEYKSHKIVRAAKIGAIEFLEHGRARIEPLDESYPTMVTGPSYEVRFHGADVAPADLGYFVLYPDGYESWSPTKTFEDGYTLVT